MLSLSPAGEALLYQAIAYLASGDRDKYLEILDRSLTTDPLVPFVATLLYPLYSRSRRLTIVSPWIDDVELMLSPSLSTLLDLPRELSISRAIELARARGTRVVLVTRPSTHDRTLAQSAKRAELYAHAELEPLPDELAHQKCIEVETYAYIPTANLTEPELAKMRLTKNVGSIKILNGKPYCYNTE
ncbi:MAG: hypothetical protein GXO32_03220 [Crenarchaeota archaeon]|nr:hypothetical protein [Thermoproteota archaeon]